MKTTARPSRRVARPASAGALTTEEGRRIAAEGRTELRGALGLPTEEVPAAGSSPAVPLPHRERVEAGLAGEDLRSVRAHLGGRSAALTRWLGAEAFALGEDVFFRSPPDLALAAHEAAHSCSSARAPADPRPRSSERRRTSPEP